MGDFGLPTMAVAAAALLLGGGLRHVTHTTDLRRVLTRQELVPRRLRGPVAAVLGPVEVLVGVAAIIALGANTRAPLVGLVMTGVGAAFMTFLLVLHRVRPQVPCGCGGLATTTAHGVGPLDLLRAGVVAGGGLGLVLGAADRFADLAGEQRATTILAGVALALAVELAATASEARPDPTETIAPSGGLP